MSAKVKNAKLDREGEKTSLQSYSLASLLADAFGVVHFAPPIAHCVIGARTTPVFLLKVPIGSLTEEQVR